MSEKMNSSYKCSEFQLQGLSHLVFRLYPPWQVKFCSLPTPPRISQTRAVRQCGHCQVHLLWDALIVRLGLVGGSSHHLLGGSNATKLSEKDLAVVRCTCIKTSYNEQLSQVAKRRHPKKKLWNIFSLTSKRTFSKNDLVHKSLKTSWLAAEWEQRKDWKNQVSVAFGAWFVGRREYHPQGSAVIVSYNAL